MIQLLLSVRRLGDLAHRDVPLGALRRTKLTEDERCWSCDDARAVSGDDLGLCRPCRRSLIPEDT